MKPFWKREPTKTDEKATEHNMIKMITMTGDYYYAWDGKLYESDGRKKMPLSITDHHAVVDGNQVGVFFEKFQEYMNIPEKRI